MKTTRLFLLGAAILMLTSCEAFIDSLSKNPVFEFAGTTVYDGQTAFLGTTATCKIGWTNHNPEIVDLSYNEVGKECNATFKLPVTAKKVTKVSLTATNLDDSSVEPYKGDITVVPWRLALYKKNGNNWERIANQTTTESLGSSVTTSSYAKIGNGTYKIQMEYLTDDGSYKEIGSIPKRLAKFEVHDIDWSGKLVGIDGHATSKDTYKEFTLNEAPALATIVNAGLGEVRHAFQLTK